jgi:hypothetical protein
MRVKSKILLTLPLYYNKAVFLCRNIAVTEISYVYHIAAKWQERGLWKTA